MHILRAATFKSKCLLTAKTLFKMHFMMYSSTEQFLIQIQKFYTPVILLTCYCTCKLCYTNKMQHTCVFLPGEDCFIFFWTVNVSPTASYEITLLGLSVCPSVHPSLSFLKIGSFFSDIVHGDS